jgi:hypothetical protein
MQLIQDVSPANPCALKFDTDMDVVVPSNMNPVGAEGNMFANLFDKVPARRAGKEGDLVGGVLYLSSEAGVRRHLPLTVVPRFADPVIGICGRSMSVH